MSSVPTSITSALESISTSCGDVIRDVGEFTPSVMAPETLVLNNHDHYLDVDWHQPREWEMEGSIKLMGLDTADMLTDIGTKACTEEEFRRLLLPLKGHQVWVIKKHRHTMSLT